MMLFKDSVEYCKLECKGKQFPFRINCTSLTSPFSVAVSTKTKYPNTHPKQHEYLIHFDQTGSKKMEYQYLTKDYVQRRSNITLPSFDQSATDMQSTQQYFQRSPGVDNIYFSFFCEQLTNFTIITQFEDDITIKYINEDMFKPQRMLSQKYVNKIQQSQNSNQFSHNSSEQFNKEVEEEKKQDQKTQKMLI